VSTLAPTAPRTMSVEEAATALGIGRTTAYQAVARGELPHIRIGRRVVVPTKALERLLDGGTPTTHATERRNGAA
jgi:excisionase family DNA binding protein